MCCTQFTEIKTTFNLHLCKLSIRMHTSSCNQFVLPIFNQFLTCLYMYYQAGNDHLITPREMRSTEMEKSVVTKSAEQPLSNSATVDADAVFLYLTEARYLRPSGSSDILKRAIRRKAAVCVVRDGVMYVQKKKKDKSLSVQGLIIRSRTRIGINIIILWTLDI